MKMPLLVAADAPLHNLPFNEAERLVFAKGKFLPRHANTIRCSARYRDRRPLSEVYLSFRGGAIVRDGEAAKCNTNVELHPAQASVVWLRSPAGPTRGFREAEFACIGGFIADVLDGLALNVENKRSFEDAAKKAVSQLTQVFPIYASAAEG